MVARPGSNIDTDESEESKEDKNIKNEDSELTTQKELTELLKEYKSILVAGANGGVGR